MKKEWTKHYVLAFAFILIIIISILAFFFIIFLLNVFLVFEYPSFD